MTCRVGCWSPAAQIAFKAQSNVKDSAGPALILEEILSQLSSRPEYQNAGGQALVLHISVGRSVKLSQSKRPARRGHAGRVKRTGAGWKGACTDHTMGGAPGGGPQSGSEIGRGRRRSGSTADRQEACRPPQRPSTERTHCISVRQRSVLFRRSQSRGVSVGPVSGSRGLERRQSLGISKLPAHIPRFSARASA